MATYKVIQDIEAEDHILGPLSLRQFIYALIAAACLYFCYLSIIKHVAFLLVLFVPPAIFCGFFAAPFGKDQPTEVWALAKIRFYFKPRRRIWDQNGMKDLVTITVPKRVEVRRTDGLSRTEVESRLEALANTIDSRGWAVKNANVNLYTAPAFAQPATDSDRLVDTSSMPQAVPNTDVNAADDILDERSNPIAQQFDQMISASTQAHRQQIATMMQQGPTLPAPVDDQAQATPQRDYWFLNQPAPAASGQPTQVVHPGAATDDTTAPASADEIAQSNALKALKAKDSQQGSASYAHMKTIKPLGSDQPTPTANPEPPAPKPETQRLAKNNDLNISTLARVANKKDLPPDEEVVISLH